MSPCFACGEPSSRRYTLVIEDEMLGDNAVCETCRTDFRELDWIEVTPITE